MIDTTLFCYYYDICNIEVAYIMIYEIYMQRTLNLKEKLKRKSQFLIGPRMTGKTSYIRNELQDMVRLNWNLLDGRLRLRAASDPGLLREEIEARNLYDCVVVIDEIQKAPQLLEEVHLLIEQRNIRFLLTGSSARILRSGGVDLLGGRAGHITMHPFVYPEIQHTGFSLDSIFNLNSQLFYTHRWSNIKSGKRIGLLFRNLTPVTG